jgi:hypothetical protein
MPRVGFEPVIPVCERAKTGYALERGAIVIGPELPLFDLKVVTCRVNTTRRIIGSVNFSRNKFGALYEIDSVALLSINETLRTFYGSKRKAQIANNYMGALYVIGDRVLREGLWLRP